MHMSNKSIAKRLDAITEHIKSGSRRPPDKNLRKGAARRGAEMNAA